MKYSCMKKIIQRGAESILYLKDNFLIKDRIKKSYRHEEIDKLKRKYPTRKEAKLLKKAQSLGVNVPEVYSVDDKKMQVKMEFLDGPTIKEVIETLPASKRKQLCKSIGEQIAILHNNDIIHNDLTTSNMLFYKNKIYFIDFGLGFISTKIEDKAVDIHLLKQALESKHYKIFNQIFKEILSGYKKTKDFSLILKRLEKVESRGRYKKIK